MVIKLIEDKEMWDTFIDQSNDGLLFHKWDFLKIIEKHTSCKLLPYGIYNGDNLICLFPVFLKNYNGLKIIFSPPPNTGVNRLGFIMNKEFYSLKQNKKETYLNIVAENFDKEIENISPNLLFICLVPNFLDIREFQWNNYKIDTNFLYTTNLNQSIDEIWNGFKKELRNQIKQVDILNYKLLMSNDISTFYEMETELFREKGMEFPVINKEYLEDIFSAYPENLKLYFLYDNYNNIVSTEMDCNYKDLYMLWIGGSKPSKIRYEEYLMWELIKIAKNSGCKKLDWAGGPDKSIFKFKSKFNPDLDTCFIMRKQDNLGNLVTCANNIAKKIGICFNV